MSPPPIRFICYYTYLLNNISLPNSLGRNLSISKLKTIILTISKSRTLSTLVGGSLHNSTLYWFMRLPLALTEYFYLERQELFLLFIKDATIKVWYDYIRNNNFLRAPSQGSINQKNLPKKFLTVFSAF